MDERINILRKYNLWGDTAFDFGFRRSEYNEKIMDFTGNRLVKILTGQRRAGKSYLLRQTARQLIRKWRACRKYTIHQQRNDRSGFHKDLQRLR